MSAFESCVFDCYRAQFKSIVECGVPLGSILGPLMIWLQCTVGDHTLHCHLSNTKSCGYIRDVFLKAFIFQFHLFDIIISSWSHTKYIYTRNR